MKKNLVSILIVLVISSFLITMLATWAKLTGKQFADDALTASFICYIVTGASILYWVFLIYQKKARF